VTSHTVNKAQKGEFNSVVEPMIKDLVSPEWSPNVIYQYASPRLKKWMDEYPLIAFHSEKEETGNIKEYERNTASFP
jgi:hypothetical protein